ncbi:MAG TPA: asparaginase [Candidatus Eisenbacteria bacterium]|nr:asparaginase [Candidatus Eisenbacteria bacterium]
MSVTERQPAVDPAAVDVRSDPLVRVMRGGRVESVHRGHVAVVDSSGRLLAWAGEPRLLVFPRSAYKPFQAVPLVESGAWDRSGLGDDALALVAGSHSGTDRHAEVARSILLAAQADESALRCGSHPPYDDATAAALRARGEDPAPIRHNCSGKHAGMLLLARHLGAPLASYVDPGHPVQRRIFERFAEILGEPWVDPEPAIDGCSAPTPRMPLSTLAHAFSLLASGRDARGKEVPALARIRDAMRRHPDMVAGEGRLDTLLLRALPGAVAKAGAEGVHATGIPDRGIGIAVKIEDGTRRALGPAVTSTLTALGLIGARETATLAQHVGDRLRNFAGLEVGAVHGIVRLHTKEGS